MKKKRSVAPSDTSTGAAPTQVRVVLTGDQGLTQNVILEVRAIAKRLGLKMPAVSIESQGSVGSKTVKPTQRSKRKSRASQRSAI
jgi:hypothetical protein